MTVIRVAGPDDVGVLVELIEAFAAEFDDTTDPGLETRVAAIGADPRTRFLLAGDPPLGFIAVRLHDVYWSARPEAWVEDLFVVPEARGRGHGRALLRAGIAAARAQGAGHFELTTTEEDVAAAALYRAEGMRGSERDVPGSGRVIWFGLDL